MNDYSEDARMPYDFDTIINRKGTSSIKHDGASLFLDSPQSGLDLLPLWVADMDFALPPEVMERFSQLMGNGVFGYTFTGIEYRNAVCQWLGRRWGWRIEPDWLVQTPGVVFALACSVQAFTQPGDSVIVQQPVYYPFSDVVKKNDRRLVNSELVLRDGAYSIDFDDFERKVVRENVKLFILCNPHNPTSRAWTEEELRRLGEICFDHGVIVVSDEIHGDFCWVESGHCPFASLGKRFAANSVVCTAPSKTFNIAGMQASNIVISNQNLRERFAGVLDRIGYMGISMPALAMTRACYECGEAWLGHLREYILGNYHYMVDFMRDCVPEVAVCDLQATYLPWIDCSGMEEACRKAGYLQEDQSFSQAQDALDRFMKAEAGLWLDAGTMFGSQSPQFERINIACPRTTLREALERWDRAVARHR